MALNVTGQQFGIVTGSLVGGLALRIWGYTAIGPASSVLALASLVTYALFVNEKRFKAAPLVVRPAAEPASGG